jgi:hypothetical protein
VKLFKTTRTTKDYGLHYIPRVTITKFRGKQTFHSKTWRVHSRGDEPSSGWCQSYWMGESIIMAATLLSPLCVCVFGFAMVCVLSLLRTNAFGSSKAKNHGAYSTFHREFVILRHSWLYQIKGKIISLLLYIQSSRKCKLLSLQSNDNFDKSPSITFFKNSWKLYLAKRESWNELTVFQFPAKNMLNPFLWNVFRRWN